MFNLFGARRFRVDPAKSPRKAASGGGGGGPAPSIASSLLLHFEGNGPYDIADDSQYSVLVDNVNGCIMGNVGQGKFNTRGLRPNGGPPLDVDVDTAGGHWALLDGAFGIDFWHNGPGQSNGLFFVSSDSPDFGDMTAFGVTTSQFQNRLALWDSTGSNYQNGIKGIGVTDFSTLSPGAHHIAFTRETDGSTCHFFIDGVIEKTFNYAGALDFGRFNGRGLIGGGGTGTPSTSSQGTLSELRVVKGSCPWTTNFAVPTAKYTS